jgi:hypothetical protein
VGLRDSARPESVEASRAVRFRTSGIRGGRPGPGSDSGSIGGSEEGERQEPSPPEEPGRCGVLKKGAVGEPSPPEEPDKRKDERGLPTAFRAPRRGRPASAVPERSKLLWWPAFRVAGYTSTDFCFPGGNLEIHATGAPGPAPGAVYQHPQRSDSLHDDGARHGPLPGRKSPAGHGPRRLKDRHRRDKAPGGLGFQAGRGAGQERPPGPGGRRLQAPHSPAANQGPPIPEPQPAVTRRKGLAGQSPAEGRKGETGETLPYRTPPGAAVAISAKLKMTKSLSGW